LGVMKLGTKLTKMPLKSPHAACHLVTFTLVSLRILCVSYFKILVNNDLTSCGFDDRSVWFVNLLKKNKVLAVKR
jgi:hypothetical protein